MEKETTRNLTISRRTLLKGSALVFSRLFLPNVLTTPSKNARYFLDEPESTKIELSPLEQYLADIEEERARVEQIFTDNDPLKNFIELSQPEMLADFNMYHPLYKAGEITYQIPWYMLMIIHAQETTFSRSPNPEINGYVGAMQIHPSNNKMLTGAALGWEFLDNLDQRYLKRTGSMTNDWEEILRASKYLRIFADIKRFSTDEENILSAVTFNYSATVYGLQRVRQYYYIKSLLEE